MLDLTDKTMKELRSIAKDLGLAMIQHEKAQQLRARIVITMEPGVIDALTPPPVDPVQLKRRPAEEAKACTPREVMVALEPFKNKIKLAFYDTHGNPSTEHATTWHVKNGPAEDSGSLTVPLKWILFKAQEIANARFPATINGEFEKVRNLPVLGA